MGAEEASHPFTHPGVRNKGIEAFSCGVTCRDLLIARSSARDRRYSSPAGGIGTGGGSLSAAQCSSRGLRPFASPSAGYCRAVGRPATAVRTVRTYSYVRGTLLYSRGGRDVAVVWTGAFRMPRFASCTHAIRSWSEHSPIADAPAASRHSVDSDRRDWRPFSYRGCRGGRRGESDPARECQSRHVEVDL